MRGKRLSAVVLGVSLMGVLLGNASAGPASDNPNLPKQPFSNQKNVENGGVPVIFGPASSSTRLAVTSWTFDGGHPDFGTQISLRVVQAESSGSGPTTCTGAVIESTMFVQSHPNRPLHLAFPSPVVLPAAAPPGDWCLIAAGAGPNQVLIFTNGYVVE